MDTNIQRMKILATKTSLGVMLSVVALVSCNGAQKESTNAAGRSDSVPKIDTTQWKLFMDPTNEPGFYDANFRSNGKQLSVSMIAMPVTNSDLQYVLSGTTQIIATVKGKRPDKFSSWTESGLRIDAVVVLAGFTKGKFKVMALITGRKHNAILEYQNEKLSPDDLVPEAKKEISKFVKDNSEKFQ